MTLAKTSKTKFFRTGESNPVLDGSIVRASHVTGTPVRSWVESQVVTIVYNKPVGWFSCTSILQLNQRQATQAMAQPSPQPHSPKDEVPPPSVSITVARKQPPPESPEHAIRRIYIILSFWAVVIFLGLPIWWRTTTIYRAKLPLQEMMEWADGKVSCFFVSTYT